MITFTLAFLSTTRPPTPADTETPTPVGTDTATPTPTLAIPPGALCSRTLPKGKPWAGLSATADVGELGLVAINTVIVMLLDRRIGALMRVVKLLDRRVSNGIRFRLCRDAHYSSLIAALIAVAFYVAAGWLGTIKRHVQ